MTINEYIEQHCAPDDSDDTLCEVTLGDLRRWAELEKLADDLMEDAMALRGEWAGWKDGSSPRYQREYDELSARIEKAMRILRPGETAP